MEFLIKQVVIPVLTGLAISLIVKWIKDELERRTILIICNASDDQRRAPDHEEKPI